MAHIPTVDIRQLGDISFDRQLALAQQPNRDYDVDQWLFVPNTYTEYRYILGTRGEKPLICVGINPYRPARCAGSHPEKRGAHCPQQRLRLLHHVQCLCPAGHLPRRYGAHLQPGAAPGEYAGLCLHSLPHTGSGGVGGLGDHHREAGLPVALPAGYDRPGRGRRRPVGHLRQALCGGASPSPPVPPGGRRAGALRRGGLRRCGGDPCCRCGPWPSPPGMRRGAL